MHSLANEQLLGSSGVPTINVMLLRRAPENVPEVETISKAANSEKSKERPATGACIT
jgi:hypothetical protein